MGGLLCMNSIDPTEVDDPKLIIDVEKVLAEAAWKMFKITFGKIERRFLKRKRYKIDVPMNYFHFEEVERTMVGRTSRLHDGTSGFKHNANSKSLLSGKPMGHSDKANPGHIGLETEFNNDTDETQTYTFQFEKVRTASVEVSYQRGFSIGGKADFSIGLPKVLGDGSISCEIDKQLQVTKATGERFEESLKTSASSDIVVSKRSRYVASVVMEERPLLADFKLVVEMSMPAKKAPIYITDTKTGEVIFVRTVKNLPRIFSDFTDVVEKVTDEEGKVRPDVVRFKVEGIVDGVQLSTHKINLFTNESMSAEKVAQKKKEEEEEEKKKAEEERAKKKMGTVPESEELIRHNAS